MSETVKDLTVLIDGKVCLVQRKAKQIYNFSNQYDDDEFLVSKEIVVLHRWERWKQKFGFIKRVDKGWITTVKDLESWRLEP